MRSSRREEAAVAALRLPGLLLGVGLGGFVDGIVLHQLLQWHHLLSNQGDYPVTTVAGLEANTLADGRFHAATWFAVAAGVALLWSRAEATRRPGSGRALVGWALVGWGVFNLLEGVVNHHLLELHHVREGGRETTWDLAFLALGGVLVVVGAVLARRSAQDRV